MDPIKTIGTLLTGTEDRDAIHIAILPVIAGEDLSPGAHITLAFGTRNIAIRARDEYEIMPSLGIVDPFLQHWRIEKGQQFWMFLHPNTITGLRHQWQHPRIDNAPQAVNDAEQWLRGFSERWGFDYDDMIAIATNPSEEDYIVAHGTGLHSRGELGDEHAQFWQHLSVLTGRSFDTVHQLKTGWSCSC
jgi:hypothetical protein